MSRNIKRTIRQETTVTLDLVHIQRVLRELAGAPPGADVKFRNAYEERDDVEDVQVIWTEERVEEHGE